MPTINKKLVIYVPPDLVSWFDAQHARTGASVAELARRALRFAAFGEGQPEPTAFKGKDGSVTFLHTNRPPVLFTPKVETR